MSKIKKAPFHKNGVGTKLSEMALLICTHLRSETPSGLYFAVGRSHRIPIGLSDYIIPQTNLMGDM